MTNKKPESAWETFAFVSGIGFHFVITIGLCIFIGRKADVYFDTAPVCTLIGIIMGMTTAVYTAYRKIKDINN